MPVYLLDQAVIDITRDAIKSVLPRTKVDRVEVGGADFGSENGINITVVLSKGSSVHLTGEQLSRIQQRVAGEFWKKGEERFPYLRYLTAQEAKHLAS